MTVKARIICGKGLNKEFEEYKNNILETEKLLQKFEFQQELNRTGLWLEQKEIERRASNTLKGLLDSNLIQNGLIVTGILEHIKEVCA